MQEEEKSWELGVLLVRGYHSLFMLVGGAPENMRWWMDNNNKHLSGIPMELIKKTDGLVGVVKYLDAMRRLGSVSGFRVDS